MTIKQHYLQAMGIECWRLKPKQPRLGYIADFISKNQKVIKLVALLEVGDVAWQEQQNRLWQGILRALNISEVPASPHDVSSILASNSDQLLVLGNNNLPSLAAMLQNGHLKRAVWQALQKL